MCADDKVSSERKFQNLSMHPDSWRASYNPHGWRQPQSLGFWAGMGSENLHVQPINGC